MSSFLELAQAVARDSGTVSDLTAPPTVTGQTGRLLRIVNWTAEGYRDIQRRRDDWRWLRREFSGQTIAAVPRYALNTTSERFKHWVFHSDDGENTFSIYLTADGQAGEGWLTYVPWDQFRRTRLFGSAAAHTGKPGYITVDPLNRLVVYPIPDDIYTIRGEYYQAPQILTADDDVPEMPEAHHEAIKWQALILLGVFDEAPKQLPAWTTFLGEHIASLERTQTPRVVLAGPLA